MVPRSVGSEGILADSLDWESERVVLPLRPVSSSSSPASPVSVATAASLPQQVTFDRHELALLLSL